MQGVERTLLSVAVDFAVALDVAVCCGCGCGCVLRLLLRMLFLLLLPFTLIAAPVSNGPISRDLHLPSLSAAAPSARPPPATHPSPVRTEASEEFEMSERTQGSSASG